MGGGQGQWEEDQQGGGKKPGEKVKEELRVEKYKGSDREDEVKPIPIPIINLN